VEPVVGQAIRQRRTSYAKGAQDSAAGGQVTPKAHKFRQRRTSYVPTESGRTSANNGIDGVKGL